MLSIAKLRKQAIAQLSASETAARDVDILLCHVLQKPLSYLRAHDDKVLTEEQAEEFYAFVIRRAEGEPIAYMTGIREFWSLSLQVTPDTLIPRPETELLVELTLRFAPDKAGLSLLDLGTGSGAIAIAIAKEKSHWCVTASDASLAAMRVAEKNARRNDVPIEFILGSWLTPFSGRLFDVIVSNPPYVADNDPHLERGDLRFEPRSALQSGSDGLDDIRIIVNDAPAHLHAHGLLMIEHGYEQGEAVQLLMMKDFVNVQTLDDLAGLPRVTMGYRA